ncbi:uncharacterized protein BJ171DRAFT_237716 [Polychytrium aggregatum]|uniref:uncharacterized protein n=1 Tax=Polychytrium aggregatum TaxID=110093 RepID=UPI0022FE9B6E|nr:uncharacterized protein BJ171DRAFT_237716 [Polychytrium aggregatum]KAI9208292.1 hypothetical protein BJ171DRAFT_237716 [Polychytrium aggregatum]
MTFAPYSLISLVPHNVPLESNDSTAGSTASSRSHGSAPLSLFSKLQASASLSNLGAVAAGTSPASGSGQAGATQPGQGSLTRVSIETAELCDTTLYIGTSDGCIIKYSLDASSDAQMSSTQIKSSEGSKISTVTIGGMPSTLVQKVHINSSRKPIETIVAVPTEARLIVFSDTTVTFYNIDTLEMISVNVIAPIKPILSICVDKFIQSPMHFTVAKRRSAHCLRLGDSLMTEKDIPMSDGAIAMARYKNHICAADQSSYKILNVETSQEFQLFPYDRQLMRPMVVAIQEDEFLLVIGTPQQTGLGMFVTGNGDAIRGTLEWPAMPKSVAFQFPYVIALLKSNVIEIHNIFNQQRVQHIMFPRSMELKSLSEATFNLEISKGDPKESSSIHVVAAGKDTIIGLKMMSLEGQISELLIQKQISRAVALGEQVIQWNRHDGSDAKKRKLKSLYERGGLVYFKDTLFDDAMTLFQKGDLDPAYLISLFPELQPSKAYERQTSSASIDSAGVELEALSSIEELVSYNLQHSYPDAEEDVKESYRAVLRTSAKEMLKKYLVHYRELHGGREDIDSSILKIYAEMDRDALYDFLNGENVCALEECEQFLLERKLFYGVGLLFKSRHIPARALETWKKIYTKEFIDPDARGGLVEIMDYILELDDKELAWEYTQWILKQDSALGVQIFTSKKAKVAQFEPSQVLDHLRPFGVDAVRAYLEHAINIERRQTPAIHTELAEIYLDNTLLYLTADAIEQHRSRYWTLSPRGSFLSFLASQNDSLARARHKLILFLTQSSSYDAQHIKDRVEKSCIGLFAERAVLHSKLGDHSHVLSLLALDLQDFHSAEQYCSSQTLGEHPQPTLSETEGRSSIAITHELNMTDADRMRRKLTMMLIELYLHSEQPDYFSKEILRLVNTHWPSLDSVQILSVLPGHWSLAAVSGFLEASIRKSLNDCREGQVIKSISKIENPPSERAELLQRIHF